MTKNEERGTDSRQKDRCHEGNFGFRKIWATKFGAFSIGINTAYRISDLRQLKLSDVLEISRGRVIVKERLAMKEQKQLNTIRSSFRTNYEK